jgi:hypothetical protein
MEGKIKYSNFNFTSEEEEHLNVIRKNYIDGKSYFIGGRPLINVESVLLDQLMHIRCPGMDEYDIMEDSSQILYFYRNGTYISCFDNKYKEFIRQMAGSLMDVVSHFYEGYVKNLGSYKRDVEIKEIPRDNLSRIECNDAICVEVDVLNKPDSGAQFGSQVRVLEEIKQQSKDDEYRKKEDYEEKLGTVYDARGVWTGGNYSLYTYEGLKGPVADVMGEIFKWSEEKYNLGLVSRGLFDKYVKWLEIKRMSLFLFERKYKAIPRWCNGYDFAVNLLNRREVSELEEQRLTCKHGRSVCLPCYYFKWGNFIGWFQDVIQRRFNLTNDLLDRSISAVGSYEVNFIEYCSLSLRQIDETKLILHTDKKMYEFMVRYSNISGFLKGQGYSRKAVDIITALWFNGYSVSWLFNIESCYDYSDVSDRQFPEVNLYFSFV